MIHRIRASHSILIEKSRYKGHTMDDATSTPSPTTKPSGMALGEEGLAKRDNEQIQKSFHKIYELIGRIANRDNEQMQKEVESEIKAKRVKRELAEEMQKLEEAEIKLAQAQKENMEEEELLVEEKQKLKKAKDILAEVIADGRDGKGTFAQKQKKKLETEERFQKGLYLLAEEMRKLENMERDKRDITRIFFEQLPAEEIARVLKPIKCGILKDTLGDLLRETLKDDKEILHFTKQDFENPELLAMSLEECIAHFANKMEEEVQQLHNNLQTLQDTKAKLAQARSDGAEEEEELAYEVKVIERLTKRNLLSFCLKEERRLQLSDATFYALQDWERDKNKESEARHELMDYCLKECLRLSELGILE